VQDRITTCITAHPVKPPLHPNIELLSACLQVQNRIDDLAMVFERLQATVTGQDPLATALLKTFCTHPALPLQVWILTANGRVHFTNDLDKYIWPCTASIIRPNICTSSDACPCRCRTA
jgi:hypothetical protein